MTSEIKSRKAPGEDLDRLHRSDLLIEGMTCAACSRRIERGLLRLEGVDEAHVNFATSEATVVHRSGMASDEFRSAVEKFGYGLIKSEEADVAQDRREGDLWRRLGVAVVLTMPVMFVSMVRPLRFDGWEWFVAALATPVVFWSGWTLHRSTLINLRHRLTTMDTLVSMGTFSAWA